MSQVRINLLPPEIATQLRARRRRNLTILVSGTVLLVFLAFYAALIAATVQARGEAARLQEERRKVQQEAAAYQQYADMRDRMTRTEGLVREAVGSPPDWTRIMADIGRQIPGSVWLTDWKVEKKDKNAQVQATQGQSGQGQSAGGNKTAAQSAAVSEVVIRGWTFEHTAVAAWLDALRDVPGLTDVRCRFTSTENLHGDAMVQFEIKAAVLSGQPFQPVQGGD
ncbi:PilN domain-containing protein [Desulforudis sp. 1088]|uniref:PilN domain-containing protein n=1 Tax=unclassified Candidatus Desulforudis TaxID=2635950 RepID=UPI003CE51978